MNMAFGCEQCTTFNIQYFLIHLLFLEPQERDQPLEENLRERNVEPPAEDDEDDDDDDDVDLSKYELDDDDVCYFKFSDNKGN